MKELSELKRSLEQKLKWNKARLDCFVRMLLSLFIARTVNLSEMAVCMTSNAQINSRYRRLQRFFSGFKFDYDNLARFIFSLFFSGKQVYLTIDRTNWYWGKSKINILTLAVAYEGVAFPLFWCLLEKAGNASACEHQTIIERFIRVFGKKHIAGILGDREFASGELFCYLNKNRIPFYIRIKEGGNVTVGKKKFCYAHHLFTFVSANEHSVYHMAVKIYGQKVFLAASRSERGELMIIATNQAPKNAIAIYLRRWEIENLFAALKTRGFRFEDTHITKPERIKKMMALLAIGFCWAHKTGEWRASIKPIIIRKYKDTKGKRRPQNNYFRYGLDFIRDCLTDPTNKFNELIKSIAVFNTPTQIQEVIP